METHCFIYFLVHVKDPKSQKVRTNRSSSLRKKQEKNPVPETPRQFY